MIFAVVFFTLIQSTFAAPPDDDGVTLVKQENGFVYKLCKKEHNCDTCNAYQLDGTDLENVDIDPEMCDQTHQSDVCVFEDDNLLRFYCNRRQLVLYVKFNVDPSKLQEFIDSKRGRKEQFAAEFKIDVKNVKIEYVQDVTARRRSRRRLDPGHDVPYTIAPELTHEPTETTDHTHEPTEHEGEYIETMAIDANYDRSTGVWSIGTQTDILRDIGNIRGGFRARYDDWMTNTYCVENPDKCDNGESFADVTADGDWQNDGCDPEVCEPINNSGDVDTWMPVGERAPETEEELLPNTRGPSAHGDPIVWTFDDQVYDLDVDGHYLASSHKTKFNHEVHISVYNHYMREIQVTNKETGEVMLSINNMGDVVNKAYPYFFKSELKKCEYEDECEFFFKEYVFDAQEFEYVVQIHPHSYEDQALKEGETGLHIDVYPHPYPGYKFEDYDGLYFSNPLVEVCESN